MAQFAGTYDRDEVWDLADVMLFSVDPKGDLWALIEEIRHSRSNPVYPQLSATEYAAIYDRLRYLKDGASIYFTLLQEPFTVRPTILGYYLTLSPGAITLSHLASLRRFLSLRQPIYGLDLSIQNTVRSLLRVPEGAPPFHVYLDTVPGEETITALSRIFADVNCTFLFSDLAMGLLY